MLRARGGKTVTLLGEYHARAPRGPQLSLKDADLTHLSPPPLQRQASPTFEGL